MHIIIVNNAVLSPRVCNFLSSVSHHGDRYALENSSIFFQFKVQVSIYFLIPQDCGPFEMLAFASYHYKTIVSRSAPENIATTENILQNHP